ncbi:MAG: hypothetical protein HQL64_08905 [Magnetococcales bacterium]|nr:hypothetical protein [Magnetococcales bacterium]
MQGDKALDLRPIYLHFINAELVRENRDENTLNNIRRYLSMLSLFTDRYFTSAARSLWEFPDDQFCMEDLAPLARNNIQYCSSWSDTEHFIVKGINFYTASNDKKVFFDGRSQRGRWNAKHFTDIQYKPSDTSEEIRIALRNKLDLLNNQGRGDTSQAHVVRSTLNISPGTSLILPEICSAINISELSTDALELELLLRNVHTSSYVDNFDGVLVYGATPHHYVSDPKYYTPDADLFILEWFSRILFKDANIFHCHYTYREIISLRGTDEQNLLADTIRRLTTFLKKVSGDVNSVQVTRTRIHSLLKKVPTRHYCFRISRDDMLNMATVVNEIAETMRDRLLFY